MSESVPDLEQAERAMAEALDAGDYDTAGELGRAISEALSSSPEVQ